MKPEEKEKAKPHNSHLFFIHNYEQFHISCLVQDRPLSLGENKKNMF